MKSPGNLFNSRLLQLTLLVGSLLAISIALVARGGVSTKLDTRLDTPATHSIKLLSTTSTENSGLLDYLLPGFTAESGIQVHVIAVGTGQALRAARDGEGDLLVVHDEESELAFIASGHGIKRYPFMYNDFLLAGPLADPAGIAGIKSAAEALRTLHAQRALFISRADDSGTHKREMQLWAAAGIDPSGSSGDFYREAGAGMGKTLNMAAAVDAYLLVDRGTWLSFNNRQNLRVMVEGDPLLFNQYSAITINHARHPHLQNAAAERLVQWLIGPAGQAAIEAYKIKGRVLFYPNYQAAE